MTRELAVQIYVTWELIRITYLGTYLKQLLPFDIKSMKY